MDREAFLTRVRDYHDHGWRLALINASSVLPSDELATGAVDLTWGFARDGSLETIRERILPGQQVPSISTVYASAFLYENEIRELFGVDVAGIAVDLKGQLYKTAERIPFSPSAIRARLEKSGNLPAPTARGSASGHGTATAPAPQATAPATPPSGEGTARS